MLERKNLRLRVWFLSLTILRTPSVRMGESGISVPRSFIELEYLVISETWWSPPTDRSTRPEAESSEKASLPMTALFPWVSVLPAEKENPEDPVLPCPETSVLKVERFPPSSRNVKVGAPSPRRVRI